MFIISIRHKRPQIFQKYEILLNIIVVAGAHVILSQSPLYIKLAIDCITYCVDLFEHKSFISKD